MIIWVLQSQRIKVFSMEDLAIGFCGEVIFIPRGIIVFSQFIVNSKTKILNLKNFQPVQKTPK